MATKTHNLTITIDESLWQKMKRYREIRWSAVMRDAAKRKLTILEQQKTKEELLFTMLASEKSLAKEWLSEEEDKAWETL